MKGQSATSRTIFILGRVCSTRDDSAVLNKFLENYDNQQSVEIKSAQISDKKINDFIALFEETYSKQTKVSDIALFTNKDIGTKEQEYVIYHKNHGSILLRALLQ